MTDNFKNQIIVYSLSKLGAAEAPVRILGVGGGVNLLYPMGMCIEEGSNIVYICDRGNRRIVALDGLGLDNKVLFEFGSDVLNSPVDITCDASFVYVADTGTHCVHVFEKAEAGNHRACRVIGTLNTAGGAGAGSSATTTTHFNSPRGVCIDRATGRLYVSDSFNHRIVCLDVGVAAAPAPAAAAVKVAVTSSSPPPPVPVSVSNPAAPTATAATAAATTAASTHTAAPSTAQKNKAGVLFKKGRAKGFFSGFIRNWKERQFFLDSDKKV